VRRDLTEAQKRHDWPTRKRAEGKSDGAGPDMWPTPVEDKRRRPHK